MRIPPGDHPPREGERVDKSAGARGASKPVAIDGAGADGNTEGSSSWRFLSSFFCIIPGAWYVK